MTLKEFIDSSHIHEVPQLPRGTAHNLDEVFLNVVERNLPRDQVIRDWNGLLLDYIEHPDAVFFIRRYASAPNKRWDLIRRGFLTEHSCGFRYVFCDNYLAHYFYLMAMKNFVPSLTELILMISERKFPYGYMRTSEEEPYQAYPKGRSVNINRSGWKLAHLYSVNQNDYDFDYKNLCAQLFPRGEQNEWNYHGNNNYPSRYYNSAVSVETKKIAVAHFLRLVHPINYFLTPKKSLSNIDIGEKPGMISFMRQKNFKKFPIILPKFESIVRAKRPDANKKDKIGFNFLYGEGKKKIQGSTEKGRLTVRKVQNSTKGQERKYSEIDLRIIEAYLIRGYSYRTIEKEVLNISSPARGGGFIAKGILNSYGVEGKHKRTITSKDIDDKITSSKDNLKRTLIELKKILS